MDGVRAITRRTVVKGGAAAGLVTVASGCVPLWIAPGSGGGPPRAFHVEHGPDVYVWIGNGAPFTVRVHQQDGTLLETFDDQTIATLGDLDSEHVTFRPAAVPTAA